jgi:hypothetical protein
LSVDTSIVIPSGNAVRARRALDPEDAETTTLGADYIVLYRPDRFVDVQGKFEQYGYALAREMPASIRKTLDGRGIAAYPEAGQSFRDADYRSLLVNHGPPLWLPTKRPRAKYSSGNPKVLLIPISATRKKMLIAHPEVVKALVKKHVAEGMADGLEIEDWVELQRALFDAVMIGGGSAEDLRADAVAPRGGLPLYEDKSIDSAKLLSATRVAATAHWLASLPESILATVRTLPQRSPVALAFPESLGTVPADDGHRAGSKRARRLSTSIPMQVVLDRLIEFYHELERHERGVLCIRYRRFVST